MLQERLHQAIADIMDELDCNMIDATITFCERESIDPEDIAKMMDKHTLDRLRMSAIEERLLRKKDYGYVPRELPFE